MAVDVAREGRHDEQAHARADRPTSTCDVAIVGAGPYGLSVAARLRKAGGLDVRIFGEPMTFWEGMPKGMLLRSAWDACSIGWVRGDLTLDAFKAATGRVFGKPVPLDAFIEYGHWFQQTAVPDVDRRRVASVAPGARGFDVTLADGERLQAGRVVVAAGIESFPRRPPIFADLPRELASHSADHRDLGSFGGRRVLVVGGGQSALESAALMHESGAEVEVVARTEQIVWLRGGKYQRRLGRMKPVFYAPTDVGPAGLSRLVAVPALFRRLPRRSQARIAQRSIRPAGARWLVSRLKDVPLTMGRSVVEATVADDGVRARLDDGSDRCVDHVLYGTGYRIDIAHYDFIAPELLSRIRCADGYPVLRRGLESTVPGLHFCGAPAAWSFGPIMRFVSGSWYASSQVAGAIRRSARAR